MNEQCMRCKNSRKFPGVPMSFDYPGHGADCECKLHDMVDDCDDYEDDREDERC